MHPTLQFINEAFDRYNRTIFRQPLPRIDIRLSSAGSCVGKFSFPRRMRPSDPKALEHCRLTFSRNFDLPAEEWEDVVIHEMLHFAIWYGDIKDSGPHGRVFRKLMGDINRIHGRNISIRHKTEPDADTADKRIRVHVVCLTDWNDGNRFITVMSRSYVTDFARYLRTGCDIKSSQWYVSKDPYFNKYPHVRSPKLFRIPANDCEKLSSLLSEKNRIK